MGFRTSLQVWLLVATTSACSAPGGEFDEGDVGSREQQLYYLSTNLWNHKIINVCFETSGYAVEKAWLKEVAKGQRSWEQAGNVTFSGFGTCASGTKGVRVILGTKSLTSRVGPANDVVTVYLKVGNNISCPNLPTLNQEQCFKRVALHELGHALGLDHEHERTQEEGKPVECTIPLASDWGDTPWGPFDTTSIMVYEGGVCHEVADLSPYDRRGIDHIYGEREGDTNHLGDFNGDGRDDILCHDTVNGGKWVDMAAPLGQFFTGTDSYNLFNWCGHDTGKLFKGDFDGDGQTDLLCHDILTGYKWVDLASEPDLPAHIGGFFGGTDWSRDANWCSHDAGQLLIGDFNGDGRDDLLCHDVDTGFNWFDHAYGNGQFNGTNWSKDTNWCKSATSRLVVGDFNGDQHDDLLCHDRSSGSISVDYADSNGHFDGLVSSRNGNWCAQPDEQLFIGDFNGDGRDDLLCHSTQSGRHWVDYANSSGWFYGSNWSSTSGWCAGHEESLRVGDVNGDGRDDLLCHQIRTGYKWVDLASSNGRFEGTDWSRNANWCTGDAQIMR